MEIVKQVPFPKRDGRLGQTTIGLMGEVHFSLNGLPKADSVSGKGYINDSIIIKVLRACQEKTKKRGESVSFH
jgi:hypothetical protein